MSIKPITKFILIATLLSLVLSACSAFTAEPTATPSPSPTATPTPPPTATPLPDGYVEYITQSGDTLEVVAAHFGVSTAGIMSDVEIDDTSLILAPGMRLLVKDGLGDTTFPFQLFPDSAVVYSSAAIGFDVQSFADEQGGFLSAYGELMTRGTTPASEIIYQLALEYSINPRILLVLMEYESGWVTSPQVSEQQFHYPFGWQKADRDSVYFQTGWAIQQLASMAITSWRAGKLTDLTFHGWLNAAPLALFERRHGGGHVHAGADPHPGRMAGCSVCGTAMWPIFTRNCSAIPFELGSGIDPIFSAGIRQPELNLPFPVNEVWNLTGGPHEAWGSGWGDLGVLAALDFAPPLASPGCGNSNHYTTAAAGGLVVRAGGGVVVIDLDEDGYEQTGWVLVYMHVANSERVNVGDRLQADDLVGHPSCEGGSSSGIHVHIARKYNGEWVLADGGLPFVLSGYRACNGEDKYEGSLVNGDITVTANLAGNYWTRIYRPESREEFSYTPTPRN